MDVLDQIRADSAAAKAAGLDAGAVVLASMAGYMGVLISPRLTVSAPGIDGFVTFAEYPGFKFLWNCTLKKFSCTPRQEATIRGNVSCAHDGTLTAAAFVGFEGSGYSWMAPIKFAPPADPNDPFGHWTATDEHFDAADGLWPLRFRAVDEAEAIAILRANPPARPTEGGNPTGVGYVPQP